MAGRFYWYWLNDCRFTLAVRKVLVVMRLCTSIAVLPGNGHVTSTFLKRGFQQGGCCSFVLFVLLYLFSALSEGFPRGFSLL